MSKKIEELEKILEKTNDTTNKIIIEVLICSTFLPSTK